MALKDCCKTIEDRERITDTQTRCKVCKANHYKLVAEPGSIGVKLNPLGSKE